VPPFRYPQFCAVARAAEIVGERWTILILRELLILGPQRFSDLRRNLSQVSPSVLSERLACLERHGLIERSELAPPAASTVYVLTEAGRAFGPVLGALAQWGAQFLLPVRDGEELMPDRLLFILGMYASKRPKPEIACELQLVADDGTLVPVHIAGGSGGTTVQRQTEPPKPSNVVLRGTALDIMRLITTPGETGKTEHADRVQIQGDFSAIARIAELFDLELPTTEREPTQQAAISAVDATDADNQGAS